MKQRINNKSPEVQAASAVAAAYWQAHKSNNSATIKEASEAQANLVAEQAALKVPGSGYAVEGDGYPVGTPYTYCLYMFDGKPRRLWANGDLESACSWFVI
jgi:hypothetical protein